MEIIKTHTYVLKGINELRQNIDNNRLCVWHTLVVRDCKWIIQSMQGWKIFYQMFQNLNLYSLGREKNRYLQYKVLFSIVNGWACVEYSGILGQIPWIWIHRWLTMIESVIRERWGNGFEGQCDQFNSSFSQAAVITNGELGFEALGKAWLEWMNCN